MKIITVPKADYTQRFLFPSDTDTFEMVYREVQQAIAGKETGLVIVTNSNTAFIDPMTCTLVSPALPYFGEIRDAEGAQLVMKRAETELILIALHVFGASYVAGRFKDMGVSEEAFAKKAIVCVEELQTQEV